jgi:hypothetical protein
LRNVGWATVDQFEWLGFKHEAREFLVWFRIQHNWTTIETIIQEDLVRMQLLKTFVSEDQSIVDIPNVTDEQVVIAQGRFEIDGPNLFTDGTYHQTQRWG